MAYGRASALYVFHNGTAFQLPVKPWEEGNRNQKLVKQISNISFCFNKAHETRWYPNKILKERNK